MLSCYYHFTLTVHNRDWDGVGVSLQTVLHNAMVPFGPNKCKIACVPKNAGLHNFQTVLLHDADKIHKSQYHNKEGQVQSNESIISQMKKNSSVYCYGCSAKFWDICFHWSKWCAMSCFLMFLSRGVKQSLGSVRNMAFNGAISSDAIAKWSCFSAFTNLS